MRRRRSRRRSRTSRKSKVGSESLISKFRVVRCFMILVAHADGIDICRLKVSFIA